MNGMALCAGAGGLELGVELALGDAYRTVCGVEWEATAAAVLVARQRDRSLPPFPVWSDLRSFNGRPWRGVVDIVTAGFPCQPFSVAGKRGGTEDPRHLWPHVARVICECDPGIVFLENVPGLLTTPLADGSGFAYELVEDELHRMGYRVATGLFTVAEVGAPHQRERLFILGVANAGCAEQWWPSESASLDRSRASDDGGGTGGTLADATLGGQRERGEPSGGERQPDGSDVGLADAGFGQLSEPGREAGGRDGAGPAGAGNVGDAEEQRRKRSIGAASDEPGEAVSTPRTRLVRGAMEDAISERGRSGDGGRPDATDVDAPGQTLPPFPPGPGDAAAWRRILAERGDLAPALSINEEWELGIRYPLASPPPQSPIRGVANGLADRLDISRTARLRIIGNGVVPMQAARAWRTLWAELTGDE